MEFSGRSAVLLAAALTAASLGGCGALQATQASGGLRGAVAGLDGPTQQALLAGTLSFPDYVAAFARHYVEGSEEYRQRRGIYEEKGGEVRAHNRMPHRRWSMTINHLSDRTQDELAKLRGRRGVWGGTRGASLVEIQGDGTVRDHQANASAPKSSIDWMHLKSLQEVPDQGGCGSCWALATAALLGARYEIANGDARSFSPQELVDCTPNKDACGGTGGCDGATMELGLEYARRHGVRTAEEVPYKEKETGKSACPTSALLESPTANAGLAFGMRAWAKLPENRQEPLMRALMDGPVGVSVAAKEWMGYHSGVFDACGKDAVVDHAVLLVGYGGSADATPVLLSENDAGSDGSSEDESLKDTIGGSSHVGGKYWMIRNSWTKNWGEEGNIRLARLDDDSKEKGHCGMDNDPKVGTACKPYPESVPVCGMCGVLYDSVTVEFEKGKKAPTGALVRSHRSQEGLDGSDGEKGKEVSDDDGEGNLDGVGKESDNNGEGSLDGVVKAAETTDALTKALDELEKREKRDGKAEGEADSSDAALGTASDAGEDDPLSTLPETPSSQ